MTPNRTDSLDSRLSSISEQILDLIELAAEAEFQGDNLEETNVVNTGGQSISDSLEDNYLRLGLWGDHIDIDLCVLELGVENTLYYTVIDIFDCMQTSLDRIQAALNAVINASKINSNVVSQIVDQFDWPAELGRLKSSTRNLNSLAKSINIERAIKSDKGPYKDIRRAVEKIETSHAYAARPAEPLNLKASEDPLVAKYQPVIFRTSLLGQHYCRKIQDRFNNLNIRQIERLGEANAIRHMRRQEKLKFIEETRQASPNIISAESNRAESSKYSVFAESSQPTESSLPTRPSNSIFDKPLSYKPLAIAEGLLEDDVASQTTFTTAKTDVSEFDDSVPHVPPIPGATESGDSVTCPACGEDIVALRLGKSSLNSDWRRHIYADLQPYVCLWDDCERDFEPFINKKVWLAHETEHYSKHHSHIPSQCQFCGASSENLVDSTQMNPLYGWLKHIGQHMKEISLAVLPLSNDENDTDSNSETSTNSLTVRKNPDLGSFNLTIESSNTSTPFAPPGTHNKLGLDDPRVTVCFDRGESFYRCDHPPKDVNLNTRTNSASGSPTETISTIMDELDTAIIRYPPTSFTQFFVPRDKLFCIMTPERVRLVIARLKCCDKLSSEEKEAFAHEVCVGGTIWCLEPCLKLLTALIGSEIEEKFVDFIEDRVTDSCLPFEFVPDNPNHVRCQMPKHQHSTMNYCKQRQRQKFCQWAYTLSAPYFKRPLNGHAHYILGDNDILPIIQELPCGPLEIPFGGTIQSEVPDSKEGGFSHVQCVKFHPSHFEFGSYSIRCGKIKKEHLFALKRLFAHDVDSFNMELASLLSFQAREDMHLIRLLVTFEVKRVSEQGHESSTFYFVFPWAEGDLWHFWRMHQTPHDRISRCVWMAEQCYKLAVALMYVHNERKLHLRRLQDVKEDEHDIYGRHGDVKAENILYFETEDILVMADFGLGRLHTKISRSNQDPKTLERTATYRAPEFDTSQGKISRSCDIFSLGCVYLEFVTWYLAGWDSVFEEFPNYRFEKDIYDFLSDTFFRIEGSPGDTRRPTIKPKVLEWIRKLRQNSNCNQYILDFLTLIEERMLDPDSKKRIRSDSLVRELDLYVKTCRTDSEYYKEPRSDPEPD